MNAENKNRSSESDALSGRASVLFCCGLPGGGPHQRQVEPTLGLWRTLLQRPTRVSQRISTPECQMHGQHVAILGLKQLVFSVILHSCGPSFSPPGHRDTEGFLRPSRFNRRWMRKSPLLKATFGQVAAWISLHRRHSGTCSDEGSPPEVNSFEYLLSFSC